MKIRTVKNLLYADPHDMGGFPIRQPFPTMRVDQIDPFLLLHHADVAVSQHVNPKHSGVGPHPHRGFSPVTFIFKGAVHHRDSRGNNSVVYAGGAQWMNAGMGVIHSERPSSDIHNVGGRQEIIQLWINTPAKHKMDQPVYYAVQAAEVPKVLSEDGLVTMNVFSGDLANTKGIIPSLTPVNAATLEIKKGGKMTVALPAHHHVFLYLLDGKLNIEGYGLTEGHHAVVFSNDGDAISFEGLEDTRALLMSGEPLNEKVVAHGPFVMNSETQILEAMRDYQMGKMGMLVEE